MNILWYIYYVGLYVYYQIFYDINIFMIRFKKESLNRRNPFDSFLNLLINIYYDITIHILCIFIYVYYVQCIYILWYKYTYIHILSIYLYTYIMSIDNNVDILSIWIYYLYVYIEYTYILWYKYIYETIWQNIYSYIWINI